MFEMVSILKILINYPYYAASVRDDIVPDIFSQTLHLPIITELSPSQNSSRVVDNPPPRIAVLRSYRAAVI